ncbi:MAG TPA: choice-of-anchor tandem repeat GloVer-containing protein [Verrucomicrobiae bacterium]|nr:choice-of-anchor tandem repeat GloVer-containing protein [Verrucomicrobiae bacterium]
MSSIKLSVGVLALALLAATNAGAVIFTNLYTFSPVSVSNPALGGSYGGNTPDAALLPVGNTLYGTTADGGTNNDGTIFVYSLSSGFSNLHVFSGGDGANPKADLSLSGKTLFGTTVNGGAFGGGTIFGMGTNGSGFTNLFNFAFTNGGNPQGGLLLSGNTLYGTTSKGGAYGAGTIFAINTNGTGFTNVYNFDYTNGANPKGDLLMLGNTLYGTTEFGGGTNAFGTVFAVNTDGTDYTNLMVFTGPNGAGPQAGLALVSNLLCGTTVNGGLHGAGTAFLVATNGTGFNILHSFGSGTDGQSPYSLLAVSSNGASSYTLYGATEFGGNMYSGALFAINIVGSAFSSYSAICSFLSPLQTPMAGPKLLAGTLYGTCTGEGSGGGIYSSTTGGQVTTLHQFQDPQLSNVSTNGDGAQSRAGLILSGRSFYGTASAGGTNGRGTVFTINTDGTGFRSLGVTANGSWAGLSLSGSILFGITSTYVAAGDGDYYGSGPSEIFSVNTDGSDFTNLVTVGYSLVKGGMALSGNILYGTTEDGGSLELGTVFTATTNGAGPTNLYSFDYTTGASPVAGPILSGNTLYGTTESGGGPGYGTVYAINTDGSGFNNIFDFSGTNGSSPVGSVVLSGSRLYGVTAGDKIRGCGTIFAVNADSSGFTNLYIFSGYDGTLPQGNLILWGNTLYGTTSSGGSGGYGTVFSINTDGSDFTTLYNFSGANDGADPYGGLLLSGNTLYGTTSCGGNSGSGTVFALSVGPIPLNVTPDGSNAVLTWGNPAFSLQSAPAFNGPYTTISGAASPYTNTITGSEQFFRLQAQ